MVTGKPKKRIIRAYYNAKVYKSDLSGLADSIHINQNIGLTQLINIDKSKNKDVFLKKKKPVLWNIQNQITVIVIIWICEKQVIFCENK